MDRQAVIDQVRKVFDTFREKEAVRNAGIFTDFINRYEQQLLELEKGDGTRSHIDGITHIYSDNISGSDAFGSEIWKAEKLVCEYAEEQREKQKAIQAQRVKKEITEAPDKQAVIEQVRKVYEKLQQGRMEDGRYRLLLNNFAYQLHQLENLKDPFGFTNSLKDCADYYASWPSGDRNPDVTVSELEEADKMVAAFQEYFYARMNKIRETDPAFDRLYRNDSKELEVTIDAARISSYKDYIDIIQIELDFPYDCEGMADRYLDWIRDLDWLPFETYVFNIVNSKDLEKRNAPLLKEIVEDFDNYIIPFWDHEAVHCILGGERKDIYLNLL